MHAYMSMIAHIERCVYLVLIFCFEFEEDQYNSCDWCVCARRDPIVRRADGDPEQGDGDGDEPRPDVDERGRAAAASHKPLGERVVVREDPEADRKSVV